jgi:predicted metal-dependent peptidase
MYHIQKNGTEVTLIEADTYVRHVSKYNYRKDVEIHGRGGTDFQPVIDFYNDNTSKYTCLVYFTDGEAPAPTPARGRMLWVLSSKSKINEELIGPQIKLN